MKLRLRSGWLLLTVSFLPVGAMGTANSRLAAYFEERLTSHQRVPSNATLLKVLDTIAESEPSEIRAALPFVSSALTSTKENLPVEAVFALFVISRRTDGAALLQSRIAEIGSLLAVPDERISGGADLTLRNLMPAQREVIVPILIRFLNTPGPASIAKVEAASVLLPYAKGNAAAVGAIERLLSGKQETLVRVVMLEALANCGVNTPASDAYAIAALQGGSSGVRLAAIRAVRSLGPRVWEQALPAVTRLALDPAQGQDVRRAAEQALHDDH